MNFTDQKIDDDFFGIFPDRFDFLIPARFATALVILGVVLCIVVSLRYKTLNEYSYTEIADDNIALESNTVGFVQLKPEPGVYSSFS